MRDMFKSEIVTQGEVVIQADASLEAVSLGNKYVLANWPDYTLSLREAPRPLFGLTQGPR